jgi:tetratricopeptide (TPR) repeat protein
LCQWLWELIDDCEGLIQLVGKAYGAEAAEIEPEHGRVSYPQFEFLYTRDKGKKTWVIVVGDDVSRDKPTDQLDLPGDENHPDPAGYQAERIRRHQAYIERLTKENHLRHSARNDTELENTVLRLRDELSELRQCGARRLCRLTIAIAGILFLLITLGGGGYWAYKNLYEVAGEVTTEKIRAHLLKTAEETHQRELAEIELEKDWQERQRLREAADKAHAARVLRINDLAASIAEIEGSGKATRVFLERSRILNEQGVDDAIAYVCSERPSILKNVKARTAAARERNRAELQPLLKTAGFYETKGQADDARARYEEILEAEPDWPNALHSAFWFYIGQGDISLVRATLTDTKKDYDEAYRLAQRLTAADPLNTQWQRDLAISYARVAYLAEGQNKDKMAKENWEKAFAVLSGIEKGGDCTYRLKIVDFLNISIQRLEVKRPDCRLFSG